MTSAGRFITLEGTDGVGKSTCSDVVHRFLAQRGIDALVTREPGGTPLGEEIRGVLLAGRDEPVDAIAETLMMFSARAQHVAALISPALASGRWVVCDRFTDSTFAYQGGGRGVSVALLETLAEAVHGDCWPHLTLYLDAPVAVARARIAGRASDRIDGQPAPFFERARAVFRQRAREQERIVEIDASQALGQVQRDIEGALECFLAACT